MTTTVARTKMKETSPQMTSLLRDALTTAPEELLLPTPALGDSARHSVKYFLDPLAKQYSTVFKEGIYLSGLDSVQIWEQTRLVLDRIADKVLYDKYATITSDDNNAGDDELEKIAKRRKLTSVVGGDDNEEDEEVEQDRQSSDDSDEDEFEGAAEDDNELEEDRDSDDELDLDNEREAEEFPENDVDYEEVDEEDVEVRNSLLDDIASEEEDVEGLDDDEEGLEDEDDLDKDFESLGSDGSNEGYASEDDGPVFEDGVDVDFVKDVHGLNSKFFNIDEFNRMTEETEQNNFLDEDDDNDEDIDYFADPDELAGSLEKSQIRNEEHDHESDEGSEDYDEDDVEGHFGSINNQNANDNANEIRYADFFAPPAGSKKSKRRFKSEKNKKSKQDDFSGLGDEFDDDNLELALGGLKKDLFALDDDGQAEGTGEDDQKISTFEKMQRKLKAQVAQLEEENVAKRDWALMGEAKARDRPLNSLLEEDLEFDRGTKPVPVITSEVTESLEEMIRSRIKTNDFNDLPRRTPDGIAEFQPSKLVDVDQTKSSKSLAEIYEEEHLREIDPDNHSTMQESKLKKAHQEVEELFADITHKLDALSSWHFTPKPAKPSISIVPNAPAISMEEAQPIAMSTESMLAPQEVYIPLNGITRDDSKKEVIRGDGLPVARAELTREERKRRRRREKARHAKMEAKRLETRQVKSQKEGSRASVVETLKKGNVTVIGKRGEKRDIEGRLKVDKGGPKGSSELKL
ncbi:Mpp10 protein-domain-containing protein [Lipomyces orientalis]|uniref:Mpp10 protein-domain-containing protein n=1 Tax=Lipomyces orientalis TaxID=1233043 RepID=A0ACC3TGY2_9ASCO